MTELDDFELLAAFNQRLSGIDREVPDPVAWPTRLRGSTRTVGLAGSSRLGLAAIAVVVAIALRALIPGLAGFIGPTPPTGSPTRESSRPSSPPPSPAIVLGPNGLPTSLGSERVFNVSDAQSHLFVATDATPFLVGGWLDDAKALCPIAIPTASPPPILLDTGLCGVWPGLVASPPYDSSGQPNFIWTRLSVLWTIFLPGSSPTEPSPPTALGARNFAVVLRVHTHDPRAASCPIGVRPGCDDAVVVNSIEWTSTQDLATPAPLPDPVPTPPISFRCHPLQLNGPSSGPGATALCVPAEVAAAVAVGPLGYPIQAIAIAATSLPCGVPWPSGYVVCPPDFENTAFVEFIGTHKVAVLTITFEPNGPAVAKLIAFEVPPSGWTMP